MNNDDVKKLRPSKTVRCSFYALPEKRDEIIAEYEKSGMTFSRYIVSLFDNRKQEQE